MFDGNLNKADKSIISLKMLDLIPTDHENQLFASLIQKQGFVVVEACKENFSFEEYNALCNWESVVLAAFNLESDIKTSSGTYRVENHVSVGYRHDDEREFFETRLRSNGLSEPNFDEHIPNYSKTIVSLYSALNKIATQCLREIATHLGLDERVFLDLTDIYCNGILPTVAQQQQKIIENLPQPPVEIVSSSIQYSSSLLRICKYSYSDDLETSSNTTNSAIDNVGGTTDDEKNTVNSNRNDSNSSCSSNEKSRNHVAFGAHTDSSFLTLALSSSTPGLEVVDQECNQWVCPERVQSDNRVDIDAISRSTDSFTSNESAGGACIVEEGRQMKPRVVVFVGEFLQVLTKNRYRACVHRVMQYSPNTTSVSTINNNCHCRSNGNMVQKPLLNGNKLSQRLSCPYLIRGLNTSIINFHDPQYIHPGGDEALGNDLIPDLDGTNMKLLHKLLDLKRQKCFRENDSKPGNWVLSAFPVENLPTAED